MFQNSTRAYASDLDKQNTDQSVSPLPEVYHKFTTFKAKAQEHFEVIRDIHTAAMAMKDVDIVWNGNRFEVLGQDASSTCNVVGEVFQHPTDATFMVECYRRAGCGVLFNKFYSILHGKCADNNDPCSVHSLEAPALNFDLCISKDNVTEAHKWHFDCLTQRVEDNTFTVDDVDTLTCTLHSLNDAEVTEILASRQHDTASKLLTIPVTYANELSDDIVKLIQFSKLIVAYTKTSAFDKEMIQQMVSNFTDVLSKYNVTSTDATVDESLDLSLREVLRQLAVTVYQMQKNYNVQCSNSIAILAKYKPFLMQWPRSEVCKFALNNIQF